MTSSQWLAVANSYPVPLIHHLGIRFLEGDAEHIIAEMRAGDATLVPGGYYFGGALLAFLETLAGTLTTYDPDVTLDTPITTTMAQMNTNFLRNTQSPRLVGTARWIRRGRRLMVVETTVHDDDGNLLVHATSTHTPLT